MELLQHCFKYASKYYENLLQQAETVLVDKLFEQAEQCKSNDEQRQFFEALQQLKSRGDAMHAVFVNTIRKQYEHFTSGQDLETSLDDKIDTSTLSLVDRDELEDELAISVIVSKSNSRNPEALWKLNRRLAVLRGGKNVSDETNPFGPARICHALQSAIGELGLDNNSKIFVYKQLGKLFVNGFADILETLNTLLIDNGILPNLNFSLSTSTPAPDSTSQTMKAPSEELAAALESAQSIKHQQQLYDAIRTLQSRDGPRTQTASGVSFSGMVTGNNSGSDLFAPIDYVLALSAIQQSKAAISKAALNQPAATESIEQKLIAQLVKQANEQGRHKISKEHADTVDVVGLIFRYMLDDPNLHDSVKSSLSHLHTPYLKLALMDKRFLTDYKHSARLLLNQMTELGAQWVKEENDRSVLPTIKKNVEVILREFIDDTSIFDELLGEFLQFRDGLEKRARMAEKRNTQSQQGLERLEVSKQKAYQELNQRFQAAKIPDDIAKILQAPWAEFLSFNLLRHGETSLAWTSALKVVDGIVWSVTPEQRSESKEGVHRHQAELEQSVTEGLNAIGYDNEASKELLASLKHAHELATLGSLAHEVNEIVPEHQPQHRTAKKPVLGPPNTRPRATKTPTSAQALAEADQQTEQTKKHLSHEETKWLENLKNIAFGTWFEFKRGSTAVQLKLAWFSRITHHYMFVDQAGVKQKVATQHDLAKGLCAGDIHIVEPTQKSFMERAFEAVLHTLRLNQ